MATIRFGLAQLACAVVFFLAACGGQQGPGLPITSLTSLFGGHSFSTLPDCPGQKTTDDYASLTETLSKKGGALCVPVFGSFGGTITYPAAHPTAKVQMISSTRNYAHLHNLGHGPAMYYLQLAMSNETTFNAHTSIGAGFTSKQLKPGNVYTVYAEIFIASIPFHIKPCWAKAVKGRYGGVVGDLGKFTFKEDVPGPTNGYLEIYPGTFAKHKC